MSVSLVIQTSFLGDMVLTTPLIAALARRGAVDVVGTPQSVQVLANNPHVRRAIAYDKRGEHRGTRGLVKMAFDLRAHGPYESAYLAQGSVRSATLALMTGATERIGFETSAGRRLYTRRVPYLDAAHHAVRLASLAGAGAETARPQVYPGPAEREAVDAVLGDAKAAPDLIAFAPGSVWATKRWPHYAELAGLVAERARVVVLGSAADAPLAAAIVERAPNAIDAAGRLSLLASAELIGRCAALVSNDSAPVHLASATNTPTVAIFGPTVPAFGFGPLADRSTSVGHVELPCRPCDRHGPRQCPLGHWRCMREVTAAHVYHHLAALVPSLFG